MKKTATRAVKPLNKRSKKEQSASWQIIHGRDRTGPPAIYDHEIHPAGIIAYFKKRYDQLKDADVKTDARGRVTYVKKPVRPPTTAGYAAEIGVSRVALWNWAKRYPEFEDAVEIARSMQEQILVEMGLQNGYNANMTIFVLKNLQHWTDKVENTHKGGVTLLVDEQDTKA